MIRMKVGYLPKILVALLVLSVGVFFISGQVAQVSAYSPTPQWCSYYYGYYNYTYWYYGYYPYYYYYYPSNCYSYYGYYYYYPYSSYYYPYYGYDYYYSYYPQSKYVLTVSTNPASLGTATGSGTFTQGTSASFSVTNSIIQTSPTTRYVFSHWSGDYSGVGTSGTITMNSAKNVVAVYQVQNYLSVTVDPKSAPVPQGEGWYNAGDTPLLTVTGQTIDTGTGSRLFFQSWNLDGQNTQSGPSLQVKMDAPHVAVALYKQQYYLKVLTDQGVASGEGWYDAGTTAPVYASTPSSTTYGVSWVFNGWQGSGAQSNSQQSSVLMDGPKTVIASWRADAAVLNLTILAVVIGAVLVVVAIVALVVLGRRSPNKIYYQQQPALKPAATSTAQPQAQPETKPTPPAKKKTVTEHKETTETEGSTTNSS